MDASSQKFRLGFCVAADITFQLPRGRMSGHDPNCPILSFLTRLAGPAGGCRSSGWALVLLARLSLALVGGVVVSFVSISEDRHFSRSLPLSSGTSVPCTRSPESAGHFVENSVMDQTVGSRRSPRATILGGEYKYLIFQPSSACPADWFRSSRRTVCFLRGALLRQPLPSSTSLRRRLATSSSATASCRSISFKEPTKPSPLRCEAKCPGRGGHAESTFQCSHGCYRFRRSALRQGFEQDDIERSLLRTTVRFPTPSRDCGVRQNHPWSVGFEGLRGNSVEKDKSIGTVQSPRRWRQTQVASLIRQRAP